MGESFERPYMTLHPTLRRRIYDFWLAVESTQLNSGDRVKVFSFSTTLPSSATSRFDHRNPCPGTMRQSPILTATNLAKVFTQFDEAFVALVLLGLLPGQDLVDFPENDQSPPTIDLERHEGSSVNPQARQANQDRWLLVFESGSC
jgi:hypothetical protein